MRTVALLLTLLGATPATALRQVDVQHERMTDMRIPDLRLSEQCASATAYLARAEEQDIGGGKAVCE